MTTADWNEFLNHAANKMRAALDNEVTLEDATEFFERSSSIENEELRQFLMKYMFEIDGSRSTYMQILNLLESGASQQDLIDYMKA